MMELVLLEIELMDWFKEEELVFIKMEINNMKMNVRMVNKKEKE